MSDAKYSLKSPCSLPKADNGDYLPRVDLRKSVSARSDRRTMLKAYSAESTGNVPSDKFLRAFQNLETSRKKANENDIRRFIMKVAGFANESYSKLWDSESTSQYSTRTLESRYNPDDLESDKSGFEGMSPSKREEFTEESRDPNRLRGNYVDKRMLDIMGRPTVKGYMFLTPTAYAHLLESHDLLKEHCHTSIELEELICNPAYSTYFARFMGIRIQLSRFLGGKYYSAQSNYQRLLQMNNRLIQWFKGKLSSSSSRISLADEFAESLGYPLGEASGRAYGRDVLR